MGSNFVANHGPALILLFFVLYIVTNVYRERRNPLSSIPGPFLCKWTDIFVRYQTAIGNRPRYVQILHRKYGSVVRVGPNAVDVAEIASAREIHRIGSGFLKSPVYELFKHDNAKSIFTTLDPKFHSKHRRLLSSPFADANLHSLEPLIEGRIRLTMKRMREEMTIRGVADVQKWFFFMASDIIGELSFGDSFRMLEQGKKNQYIKDIEIAAIVGEARAAFPELSRLAAFLPVPFFKEANKSRNRIVEYTDESINRYKKLLAASPDNVKPTLFTKLYNAGRAGLPDAEIRDDASDLIIAGSDTTANTLTYLTWAVCKRPIIRQALVAEVATLPEQFSDKDVQNLSYLNQVIDETLRLYPAVPCALPRVVPPRGANFGGHWVPGGSTVTTQLWSLHRDPVAFSEPENFDPSRWSSPTQEMKDAFMPFGAGTRNCLELHLARIELRLATAHFFRQFPRSEVSSREGMSDEDMEQVLHFLVSTKGHRCLLEVQ
ncbi:cytochrome P450 [Aspergillus vadensis CBS 113365]|uniref:Cytochrome P450 n=1 Tax=Aspergillus vadensis (strain CBS 113365 / IMI 142717 / IBT 24658) TaxID=1448311 RepID=A0A319BKS0_ASPVC|nr:cytochrome P450 [Aspergillus vadensis CBS 113365]PYH72874.1 cytochrome P450 [Aspergillus vadensis CBS 113365]